MTDRQMQIVVKLEAVPTHRFKGSMGDLVKFHETYLLRIGIDNVWLEQLYDKHFNPDGSKKP